MIKFHAVDIFFPFSIFKSKSLKKNKFFFLTPQTKDNFHIWKNTRDDDVAMLNKKKIYSKIGVRIFILGNRNHLHNNISNPNILCIAYSLAVYSWILLCKICRRKKKYFGFSFYMKYKNANEDQPIKLSKEISTWGKKIRGWWYVNMAV